MAVAMSSFLLMALHFWLVNGSMRREKMLYRPFGPNMCRELCRKSNDTFLFTTEFLSCRRFLWNNSDHKIICPTSDSFICSKGTIARGIKSVAVVPGGNIFTRDDKGSLKDDAFDSHILLTTEKDSALEKDFVKNSYNITLHQACTEGNLEAVKFSLSHGGQDINCRGKLNRTPVMVAARYGHLAVFDFLVSRGCNMSLLSSTDDNVLHVACMGGHVGIVEKIITSGTFDIDVRGSYGRTPLMYAARFGHRRVFDLLKSRGCYMFSIDNGGNNVLHMACFGCVLDMVEIILSNNIVNINSRELLGMTPVMVAAKIGCIHVVKLLVSKGCNLNITAKHGNTILHAACHSGHVELVEYILGKTRFGIESRGQFQATPIMKAALRGHVEVMDLLVSRGCNVNAKDEYGDNILHLACEKGQVHVVKYILKHDLIGIESEQRSGRTPVMIALIFGRRDVVHILIRAGCDLKGKDLSKNNILHMACAGGDLDIVKYLMSLGVADVKARNIKGYTPAKIAQLWGHDAVFEFLKSRA